MYFHEKMHCRGYTKWNIYKLHSQQKFSVNLDLKVVDSHDFSVGISLFGGEGLKGENRPLVSNSVAESLLLCIHIIINRLQQFSLQGTRSRLGLGVNSN